MKWAIKDKPQKESTSRLQYIAGGPMATPEISVLQAQKEIVHFAERMQRMDSIWAGVIVSDRTVNVHITRLRKKLGPYASHIVSRQGFGYVFETED